MTAKQHQGRRWRQLIGALAVLTLLAAACAGDDDDASSPAPAEDSDADDSGAADSGAAVDDEPLKIGIIVQKGDPGAAAGIDNDARPANKDLAAAYVEHLNSEGGIAGRQIDAVIAELDLVDQELATQARLQNEICVQLTEDEHVFMVLAAVPISQSLDCFADHETPVVNEGFSTTCCSQSHLDALDGWKIPPMWASLPTVASALPASLARQDFINETMAIVSVDIPDLREPAEEQLIPGIEEEGGTIVEAYFAPPTSIGELVAGIETSVLRFKESGVDRVIVWLPGGLLWILFGGPAESQDYHPRYAISTLDDPADASEHVPPGQLPGTVGIGFSEAHDVSPAEAADPTAEQTACWDIVGVSPGTTLDGRSELRLCDMFGAAVAALAPAAGKALAPEDVLGYYHALGDGYESLAFGTSRFEEGRSEGVDTYSDLAFDDSCSCFKYVSDPMPFG